MRNLLTKLRESRGSASVEFSILAIPLFLPLFIYFASFAHASDSQSALRTLARESARAFVSSANDEIAFYVAKQVIFEGGQLLGYQLRDGIDEIDVDISCSEDPCISPDSEVRVALTSKTSEGESVRVSAIEYVSPWA
jgi:hypothetical protein